MGKKCGPCSHCGIHFTPLWRTGPEDKLVLCNACGSRYRKMGSLEDYLPNHCQPLFLGNSKNFKGRKNLKGGKYQKSRTNLLVSSYLKRGKYRRLWNPKIPSRKRSPVVFKKMTPMKRFQIQLLKMGKIYGMPNESSPEEVLLFNNVNNFIPSDEIGLGCALLKPGGTSA